MAEFLAMGGYAQYVWSAFGISLVALLAIVWATKRSLKRTLESLRRQTISMEGKL